MQRLIQLREGDPPRAESLTGDQARRLAASGLVEVRPGPGNGTWLLRADRIVGAVRIGDVELHLAPKVPIGQLLFLLGYTRDPTGWRERTVSLTDRSGLVPAMADALWRQTERGIRAGVPHGYEPTEITSAVLRGRVREAAQARRWAGRPLPLEIRYDEFTTDIAENRILASAIDRMSRVPGVRPESRRMLRHLAASFTSVTRLIPGEPIPSWTPSRLNARLRTALHLAELVLAGRAVDAGTGQIMINGFLLDLALVFEEFVTVALRVALQRRHGGKLTAQSTGHLDLDRRIGVRPDLTWRHGGRVVAVIDAKYKRQMPAADAYQMLAYCTAYGLPEGHLVYPTGGPLRRHVIRNANTNLICHFLDLGQDPAALLGAVDRTADVIARGGLPGRPTG